MKNNDLEARIVIIDAFGSVGCMLELQENAADARDKVIAFRDGPHTDNDTIRENINREEKALLPAWLQA